MKKKPVKIITTVALVLAVAGSAFLLIQAFAGNKIDTSLLTNYLVLEKNEYGIQPQIAVPQGSINLQITEPNTLKFKIDAKKSDVNKFYKNYVKDFQRYTKAKCPGLLGYYDSKNDVILYGLTIHENPDTNKVDYFLISYSPCNSDCGSNGWIIHD